MPYYDTTAPTPSSKNSITRTATEFGLRDALLNRNIQNPIKYPFLSTSINGSPKGGEPFLDTMVGSGVIIPQVSIEIDGIFRYENAVLMNHYKNDDIPILTDVENIPSIPIFPTSPMSSLPYNQEDITKYGILAKSDFKQYRKLSTIKNVYLDSDKQTDAADTISLQPQQTTSQRKSYLDEYGRLNIGNTGAIQTADIVGSILNGQGVGLSRGGLVPNFDIRASIAGRVLTATGLMNDTKLGVIGGQQLALSLANNATFNVQQELLGKLNVTDNILSLIKGGNLSLRPDYKITVPSSKGGKVLGVFEKILGFNVPKSYLDPAGSIFQSENNDAGNIERANSMLLNTGKGQIKSLIKNISENTKVNQLGHNLPDKSVFRSGYAPGYRDSDGNEYINHNGYAFMSNDGSIDNILYSSKFKPIPELSYNREAITELYGFTGPILNPSVGSLITQAINGIPSPTKDMYGNGISHIKIPTFSWGAASTGDSINKNLYSSEISNDKKTILGKTQMLFNSFGMKNIVSVKGDMSIKQGSQIQTSVAIGGGVSKGSAVLKGTKFDEKGQVNGKSEDAENTFCRVWTNYNRYDSGDNLIRSRALNRSEGNNEQIYPEGGHNGGWRQKIEGSVLEDGGHVKIAPYKTDDFSRKSPKRYMFSIENLAWAGTPAANLLPCEQGSGDLLSGKFGKIMWFPPYDLAFSESSSLNIESTNFIGRGEPIYTYNNTERTGNLSFKVIVDHPAIMNSFAGVNGPSDDFIRSWYAGCVDLNSSWASKLTEEQKSTVTDNNIDKTKQTVTSAPPPTPINIYFLNDVTTIQTLIDTNYESGISNHKLPDGRIVPGIGYYHGEQQQREKGGKFYTSPLPTNNPPIWPDTTDNALNGSNNVLSINSKVYTNGWNDETFKNDLKQYLANECTTCVAKCVGYASSQRISDYANNQLAIKRAESMKKWLIDNEILDASRIITKTQTGIKSGKYNNETPVDQKDVKVDRVGGIIFENKPEATKTDSDKEIKRDLNITLNESIKNRFYTECDFFEKVKREDPFVYDTIKERIRYFHPSFHSTTPEGFNSRLTFLLQCTRQGATIANATPKNLAFGPAPVCILRIGDFYNTKIIMDNVSFDFDPLVWDLNPEGVGVQPMIANVSITFKYIGGSSLQGPINKLQNALSFNYFANTQTFDPRADYIAKAGERKTKWTKNSEPEPNYILVPGIDPVTISMSKITSDEISLTIEGNQASDKAQVGGNEKANSKQETKSNASIAPKTITYSNTVNYNSSNFLDDIHGAASSSAISNDFSERVGNELRAQATNVMIKQVTMQTTYDATTKNATTMLTAVIGSSDKDYGYKHFDARGSIGRLVDKANTFGRFNQQHDVIMSQFKTKNIIKVGSTIEKTVLIEGVEYLYFEAFYQWSD